MNAPREQSHEHETTILAIVSGRVQGVGYRHFVITRAERLGLTGSARNLPDGRVEVRARGPRGSLEELIAELHQGPSFAIVTNVDVNRNVSLPRFDGFGVSY